MYHLGVLDIEIGIIMSVGRLVQMVMALLGGVITDKFGRRKTTFIVDCISWSIPMLIWAFSQNFWWFLAAALINGVFPVTSVSWECLWVDDAEEKQIGPVVNWIYISGLMAVFFAPIAGYFVHGYGVVPVMRILYLISFVFMTAKFIILYIYSTETERGKERMEATKDIPMAKMLAGYKDVFKQILQSREMVRVLMMQAIVGVILMVSGTFFALYTTQNLSIPEEFMAYFPILRAGIMLAFLLFIQEKLDKFKPCYVMMSGIVLTILSLVWLLTAPPHNWIWLVIYIIIDACAMALILPRIDAQAASAIDPKERARIRSLFNMIILAVSSPFAFFSGWLSDTNRQLPFVLNLAMLGLLALIVLYDNKNQKK